MVASTENTMHRFYKVRTEEYTWAPLVSIVWQYKTSVGDVCKTYIYKSPIEVLYCQPVDANGAHVYNPGGTTHSFHGETHLKPPRKGRRFWIL